ncbi:serine hydrolase domain-containing protein [Gracilimonas sp.]|uniref:serine hydrolase domain-containing protein n=1 Tax=Gracilimonas sp. TaxID=1974203 RepID=UPI002872866E|nr:serine hydrolase [Gracilimonas sp.]
MKRIITFFFLLGCFLLTNTAFGQTHPAFDQEQRTALLDTLEKVRTDLGIPGIGIALVAGDSVAWSGGVGFANTETQQPVTASTMFRAGSVSKTFVALAIMKLAEEGKISLDSNVSDIAPEVEINNAWSDEAHIKVAHLLEHTAGFDDMHFSMVHNYEDDYLFPLNEAFDENPKAFKSRWKPGTRYAYSNPGYALAGYLVEKVTGETFEEYVQREILNPLGMNNSSFLKTDEVVSELAMGYLGENKEALYQNIYYRPAGALHTSPEELAKLVRFLQNPNDSNLAFATDSLIQRMEYPKTTLAAKKGLRNGYGLGISTTENKGFIWHGHDGGIDGFVSSYAYSDDPEIGFVILINSTGGSFMTPVRNIIRDFMLQDSEPMDKITDEPQPELYREFSGYYRAANPRNQLLGFLTYLFEGRNFSVQDDTLYSQGFLQAEVPLVPAGEQLLRNENRHTANAILMESEDLGKAIQIDNIFYQKDSPVKIYLARLGFFWSFFVIGLVGLVSLFWLPFELYRLVSSSRKAFPAISMITFPFLASLCIPAIIGFAYLLEFPTIGMATVPSVMITLCSLGFAVFSILSGYATYLAFKEDISRWLLGVYSLLSITLIGFIIFMGYWNLIGIRLWVY